MRNSPDDLRLPPLPSSAAALAFWILASGSRPQSEMVCCLTMLTTPSVLTPDRNSFSTTGTSWVRASLTLLRFSARVSKR